MRALGKKLKDMDIFRRVPQELTEGSIVGGVFSMFTMVLVGSLILFEFSSYMTIKTSTSITIDGRQDELLRINFNLTFPELSCDLATVDVVNFLGVEQANITKNIRKWRVDGKGWEKEVTIESGHHPIYQQLDSEAVQPESDVTLLTPSNFKSFIHSYPIVFVEFFAPWCHWCQKLAPVWTSTALELKKKSYAQDARLAKVDCTDPNSRQLCLSAHVQAFPTLVIYQQTDHSHIFYRGDRTVQDFLNFLELFLKPEKLALPAAHVEDDTTKDGCRLAGFIEVPRAPGNFHVSAHNTGYSLDSGFLNLTHLVKASSATSLQVHQVSFGAPLSDQEFEDLPVAQARFVNTLHGRLDSPKEGTGTEYFMKVVSTDYQQLNGRVIKTYQYTNTVGKIDLPKGEMPFINFTYDLSPMAVLANEHTTPFYHFLTSLFGLIGGSIIVLRFFNNLVDDGLNALRKKTQLGKAN